MKSVQGKRCHRVTNLIVQWILLGTVIVNIEFLVVSFSPNLLEKMTTQTNLHKKCFGIVKIKWSCGYGEYKL